jgi:hypothetical protein
MSWHKEQQGFLTIAVDSKTTDYLNLAYLQALNIKATQKIKSFAVIVDSETYKKINEDHKKAFDYIIEVPTNDHGPFGVEPQVFWLTPFKETIKLESDMLFPTSIDHWWDAFRFKDIVLSTGCKNYLQEKSFSRKYRKLFDDNNLPDVYNGLMYFRFSKTATNFFKFASLIFEKWNEVKLNLLGCDEEYASTDVVYALCARIIGEEQCTLPSCDFINFVHMKPAINDFVEQFDFTEVFVTEFFDGIIRINNVNQYHPLHYYNKKFPTKEMYDYFRSMAGIT